MSEDIVAELEALVEPTLAAYDGQLVVRFNNPGDDINIFEYGMSTKEGASVWAWDREGNLLGLAGDAFGEDVYTSVSLLSTFSSEQNKLVGEAAARAGLDSTTLLRVTPSKYRFWNVSYPTVSDVEDFQKTVAPVGYVEAFVRTAGDPGVTITKETSGDEVHYVWTEGPLSSTLVVRGGIVVAIRNGGAPAPFSDVEVVAYGSDVTPPAVPESAVSAAEYEQYFAYALSYAARSTMRFQLRVLENEVNAKLALKGKKATISHVRTWIRKTLKTVPWSSEDYSVRATRKGVLVTDKTQPWGPITFAVTYDKSDRKVTLSERR